ncbi:MAG: phosphatase PAP2 family protein [Ghiorsea sp.]|nr:phosphatase PAP2 family protein [Ghiorsea sp.]
MNLHPTEDKYPKITNIFSTVYDDYPLAYKRVFNQDALPYWWVVGLSTAALIAIDDKLISAAARLGNSVGLNREDNTKTSVSIGNFPILRLPTDIGSAMYFIGDGWTHATIAAGFLAVGAWTDDDKAYATGFQIVEGMITTTIATQTIKHLTGRESPFRATQPTGRWDFFPNQVVYNKNIPAYDAFPSGHLAVGSMVLTVVHKNYPDKAWIMPTGVTLLSLLSLQMMNNGVHWASDYPLAIASGYTFGSIAFERGQRALLRGNMKDMSIVPIVSTNGMGLGVSNTF